MQLRTPCATLITSKNPPPQHQPHYTHLAYLLYSPFSRLPNIYSCHPQQGFPQSILFGFPPARLVFHISMYYSHLYSSLDFPLLGWVISSASQGRLFSPNIRQIHRLYDDIISFKTSQRMSTRSYIVYVLYGSAEPYSICVDNVSNEYSTIIWLSNIGYWIYDWIRSADLF